MTHNTERRLSPRYQFVAEAEVIEIATGMRMKAKTSDLSIGGCFLDTLNPSQQGTEVRVTILHDGTVVAVIGRVMFAFPNLGMGISFTRVNEKDLETLKKWVTALNSSHQTTR